MPAIERRSKQHCTRISEDAVPVTEHVPGSVLLAVILLLAWIGGCSDSDVNRPPEPWNPLVPLFDMDRGHRMEAVPDSIVSGGTILLITQVKPLYIGKGYLFLQGHGGGMPIGQILQPMRAELHYVTIPVEFSARRPLRQDWIISIDESFDHVGMTVMAKFDSVEIEGTLYSIDSYVVARYFGPFMLPRLGQHITMDRKP
jgi:hypothetical protein